MNSFLKIVFILSPFLYVGCATTLSKKINEIQKISYQKKTFTVKSYFKSQIVSSNTVLTNLKNQGWSETLEGASSKDDFNFLTQKMCTDMGESKAILLNAEIKSKTTPMYSQSGVSCFNGICSGGRGQTTLREDNWTEKEIKCISERNLASSNSENNISSFKVINIKGSKALIQFTEQPPNSKVFILSDSNNQIHLLKKKKRRAIVSIGSAKLEKGNFYEISWKTK